MKRGMPSTHRLLEAGFRPKTAWTCRGISILLFALCFFLVPSTTTAMESMTFHTVFDSSIAQYISETEALLLKQSVSLVTGELGRMLKVADGEKPLIIKVTASEKEACKYLDVPANLKGEAGDKNVMANFALFISAQSCTSKDMEAVSTLCSMTNRPLSGVISFCTETMTAHDPALLIAVTARHIVSLLAFDWRIIRRGSIAKNDKSCYLLNALTHKCWNLNSKAKLPSLILASPKVLSNAKAFTGNNSLQGLPLSEDGRAWDSSVMFTSLLADSPMTKQLAPWLSFDSITLGLLDDLSWYQVQWDVFRGDDLMWGRGGGSLPKSCGASCALGFCNHTTLPCFQLGPRKNSCVVCQQLGRLRMAEGLVCIVNDCLVSDQTYKGVCTTESRDKRSECPQKGKRCLTFQKACRTTRTPTFVAKLAARISTTITTPRTSTIASTSSARNGYHFSLRFNTLDYDSVAIKRFDDITSQVVTQVSKLLGVTDRQVVKVTRISKGSTVVDFIVYDTEYSAKKIFLLLHQGMQQNVLTLTLDGKSYQVSEIKSSDYEPPRSYLTEVIVGSTFGLVLIIGVTSVVIIIVVKKVKRSANTVYPSPEVPSDGDSEFGRSNSLQTVSVASNAAIYELHRDWGSSTRPTSLRNVVVGGANLQTRISLSEDSGQL